jgi:glutathione peroxidase
MHTLVTKEKSGPALGGKDDYIGPRPCAPISRLMDRTALIQSTGAKPDNAASVRHKYDVWLFVAPLLDVAPANRTSSFSARASIKLFMPENDSPLYGFSANLIDGQPISLSYFRGRVLLVVNTASHCGFTPQYAAMEELYNLYSSRGFEVLAFPSNQFGKQEPGTAAEIAEFCNRNYKVNFPLFAKVDVNGPEAHPLYQWLKEQKRGFLGMSRIPWNFTKFLIDRKGEVVSRHAPSTDPMKLTFAIEALLHKQ